MDRARYLLDSNVLLRWLTPGNADFILVGSALDGLFRQRAQFCYTSQNVAEFWNVCTRPVDRNGYGLSPEEADRRATQFEGRLRLLPNGLQVHQEWRSLIVKYQVCGAKVHDTRLVAAMHVHQVPRILTFNTRDFARFTDIQAVHPEDVLP